MTEEERIQGADSQGELVEVVTVVAELVETESRSKARDILSVCDPWALGPSLSKLPDHCRPPDIWKSGHSCIKLVHCQFENRTNLDYELLGSPLRNDFTTYRKSAH